MSETRTTLFSLEEEYKSLYFMTKDAGELQEARIILGKLFIISQLKIQNREIDAD